MDSNPKGKTITSRAPSSRMRWAMTCESLVVSAQARSTRPVTTRIRVLWVGVSRMSLPQAEPTTCARKP